MQVRWKVAEVTEKHMWNGRSYERRKLIVAELSNYQSHGKAEAAKDRANRLFKRGHNRWSLVRVAQ